jgi:hypothetical protein
MKVNSNEGEINVYSKGQVDEIIAPVSSQLADIVLNVKSFGAVLDGVTDDSAAINAAIAALPTNGTLLIRGNAKVLSSIVMKSNVNVLCYGTIQSVSQDRIIDFTGVNDSSWVGGDIVGDGVTFSSTGQSGFFLTNACRNRIQPLTVSNCLNKGIALSAQSSLSEVTTDNYISVIKVSGCSSSAGAGISLFGDACERNIIDKPFCTTNRIGITINGSHRNKVVTPDCSNNSIAGIMIDGIVTDSGDGGKYNQILNPICNNNGSSSYGGIYLGNGSSYNKIVAPICNNNTGSGFRLTATQGTNECIGNEFLSPSCESNGALGINISGSGKNIIIAPVIKLNTGNGIQVYKSDFTQIIGGVVIDNTLVGVKIQSGYSKLIGTRISTNGAGGYQVATGGSTDSSNNIITGGATVTGNTTFDCSLGAGLVRVGDCPGAVAKTLVDAGDANFSFSLGKETTVIYATAITALRSVTLSTTNALNGDRMRVIRASTCTGAFSINVGTGPLKALTAAGQWCDVEYNGTAWVLTGYGAL